MTSVSGQINITRHIVKYVWLLSRIVYNGLAALENINLQICARLCG